MKFRDVTPAEFVCHSSTCCPAVLETENGSYVIIGKRLSISAMEAIKGKVGDDEFAIEVSKGMIDGLR